MIETHETDPEGPDQKDATVLGTTLSGGLGRYYTGSLQVIEMAQ
jgi:hypothetical protein